MMLPILFLKTLIGGHDGISDRVAVPLKGYDQCKKAD